jgi:hypothetical protein
MRLSWSSWNKGDCGDKAGPFPEGRASSRGGKAVARVRGGQGSTETEQHKSWTAFRSLSHPTGAAGVGVVSGQWSVASGSWRKRVGQDCPVKPSQTESNRSNLVKPDQTRSNHTRSRARRRSPLPKQSSPVKPSQTSRSQSNQVKPGQIVRDQGLAGARPSRNSQARSNPVKPSQTESNRSDPGLTRI